jgi:hypothetical protein
VVFVFQKVSGFCINDERVAIGPGELTTTILNFVMLKPQ